MTVEDSSKAKSIELLQTTIEQLQSIVEKIKTEALLNLPNPVELENLLYSSQQIAEAIDKPNQVLSPKVSSNPPIESRNQPLIIDRGEIKTTSTPVSPAKKPSSSLLIGIISAVVIFSLIIAILKITPPKFAAEPIEVVETPQETEIIATQPSETPIPKPVKTPPPLPPKLEITPEQGLIAAIQTEVDEITDEYTEDLIKSVEADFLASRLIIQVGEDWYQLTPSQQQKMANQILLRSQILDFRKLELRDTEGVILARNPVVGENMVLLK